MTKLMDTLAAAEAEVLEALAPLYAELRHSQAELAQVRKAKRALAPTPPATKDTEEER